MAVNTILSDPSDRTKAAMEGCFSSISRLQTRPEEKTGLEYYHTKLTRALDAEIRTRFPALSQGTVSPAEFPPPAPSSVASGATSGGFLSSFAGWAERGANDDPFRNTLFSMS